MGRDQPPVCWIDAFSNDAIAMSWQTDDISVCFSGRCFACDLIGDSSALRLRHAGLGGPDVDLLPRRIQRYREYRRRWSLRTDFDAIPVCGPFFSLGQKVDRWSFANVMTLFLAQPLEFCILHAGGRSLAESYSLFKPVRMVRTLNGPPARSIPLGNLGNYITWPLYHV